jgi:hypothetical protein
MKICDKLIRVVGFWKKSSCILLFGCYGISILCVLLGLDCSGSAIPRGFLKMRTILGKNRRKKVILGRILA